MDFSNLQHFAVYTMLYEVAYPSSHFDLIAYIYTCFFFASGKPSEQYFSIKFHGEPKVAILTSSTATVDMPDVGVSLSIQQQALNLPVELLVHPCLTGPFVLPDHHEAVSPVYLIQPHTDREIHSDVTVCMQHYASLKTKEDCMDMKILSASSKTSSNSSYVFRKIAEITGKFKEGGHIGEIDVKEFGFFVVAKRFTGKGTV